MYRTFFTSRAYSAYSTTHQKKEKALKCFGNMPRNRISDTRCSVVRMDRNKRLRHADAIGHPTGRVEPGALIRQLIGCLNSNPSELGRHSLPICLFFFFLSFLGSFFPFLCYITRELKKYAAI